MLSTVTVETTDLTKCAIITYKSSQDPASYTGVPRLAILNSVSEHTQHDLSAAYNVLENFGENDRIYLWKKPQQQSSGSQLTQEEWALLPESMEVRISRFKYQKRHGKTAWMYLSSTLLDAKIYPYEELCERY